MAARGPQSFRQFRRRGRRGGLAIDLDHQDFAVPGRCGGLRKPRPCVAAQPQDQLLKTGLRRRPLQKQPQEQHGLRITHLGRQPDGTTGQQQAETVAGQPQLKIQGVIPAADAVEVGARIADLAKERAQLPDNRPLAFVPRRRRRRRCPPLRFAHLEKELQGQPPHRQHLGHQLRLKRKKAQGLTTHHPSHERTDGLGDAGLKFLHRQRSGRRIHCLRWGHEQIRGFHRDLQGVFWKPIMPQALPGR